MEQNINNLETAYDLEEQHRKNIKEYLSDEMQNSYVEVVPHATLARAYVPFQKIDRLYSPKESLKYGTVFPELNQPEFYYH